MATKINNRGERTVLTHTAALKQAEHNARHRHGEWFAWQHKSGEWYVSSRIHQPSVVDAALNVEPKSRIYLIGGGGPGSMTFNRFSSSIVKMWARDLGRIGRQESEAIKEQLIYDAIDRG